MRTIEINKMLILTFRLRDGFSMYEKNIITKDLIDLFMDSKYSSDKSREIAHKQVSLLKEYREKANFEIEEIIQEGLF